VGLPPIDLDGASAPARTLALLEGYGASGRQAYLVFLSLDCLVPVAASLLMLRLYYAATRAWAWTTLQSRVLVAIGVLPAVADLGENTLYALLAAEYPRHATVLSELAYKVTLLKLASGALALATLLLLTAAWLRTSFRRRRLDDARSKVASR
jgi:predicted lysophospholipase L1 biosynthesis ABC-type transport system permease subunit